jgi:hypothetical protein
MNAVRRTLSLVPGTSRKRHAADMNSNLLSVESDESSLETDSGKL